MKVKLKKISFEQLKAIKPKKQGKPIKPNLLFRTLLKLVCLPDMLLTKCKVNKIGMEKLGKNEPCLFLMNHSSFLDLKIAMSALYPRPVNIVTTSDAFIGKNWLMKQLGCISVHKFMANSRLIRDMLYALRELKSSVLMYPEAGYSIDGTTTVLPESLGKCIKMLGVPVVMITAYGAYTHQPLYNYLKKRKTPVWADMEYVLSPEQISQMSADEINAVIEKCFSFDNFRWQKENEIIIDERDRADGLNKILYKCPNCHAEAQTVGAGTSLTCNSCGKEYELTELGEIKAKQGETEISHIPAWYRWQRKCVRKELEQGEYKMDMPVDIRVMVDTYSIYDIGEGRLVHDENGFVLTSTDGELIFKQSPTASYTVNADFYWYQIADTVCIGDHNVQYYCFPKRKGDYVVKMRLAAEELYKMLKSKSKQTV